MGRKHFWKPFSSPYAQRPDRRRAAWLLGRSEDRFARKVASLNELDSAEREAFWKTLRPNEPVLWIIYAPFQAYLRGRGWSSGWFRRSLPWEYSLDWVIVLTAERLLLVQRMREEIPESESSQVISIPFEAILSLQSGAVLLFSWFEVQWVEGDTVRQQTVYFNAVCTELFARLCELIRCRLAGETWAPSGSDECNLAVLNPLPYKFRNMIPLHALLDGEQVVEMMFRPALWKKRLVAFRTMTAPRLAAVLTNLHLILTEEDLTGTEGTYGFISTFLPLNRISRVVLEGQRLVISLALPGGLPGRIVRKLTIDFPIHKMEEAIRLASSCERILSPAAS